MSEQVFDAPATAAGGRPQEIEGHLVLVWPLEYVEQITTSYGERDAAKVRVVDLDTGEEHADVLWFPARLVGFARKNVGKRFLGRVTQGEATKAGQSPPWQFESAHEDPEAVKAANAWLAGNPQAATAPEPAPQAPAQGSLDADLAAQDDGDAPGF
jgi:hypothetical protein